MHIIGDACVVDRCTALKQRELRTDAMPEFRIIVPLTIVLDATEDYPNLVVI